MYPFSVLVLILGGLQWARLRPGHWDLLIVGVGWLLIPCLTDRHYRLRLLLWFVPLLSRGDRRAPYT